MQLLKTVTSFTHLLGQALLTFSTTAFVTVRRAKGEWNRSKEEMKPIFSIVSSRHPPSDLCLIRHIWALTGCSAEEKHSELIKVRLNSSITTYHEPECMKLYAEPKNKLSLLGTVNKLLHLNGQRMFWLGLHCWWCQHSPSMGKYHGCFERAESNLVSTDIEETSHMLA